MKFRQALGEVIRSERQAKGLRMRDVSLNGYISLGHLSDVERGVKDVSSEMLEGIATGLNVNTFDLIIEAGYRIADLTIPYTPEQIFSFERLLQAHSQT